MESFPALVTSGLQALHLLTLRLLDHPLCLTGLSAAKVCGSDAASEVQPTLPLLHTEEECCLKQTGKRTLSKIHSYQSLKDPYASVN